MRYLKSGWVLVVVLLLVAGCARYERRPISFRMPSEYPNSVELEGAVLAADAWTARAEAKENFGFDIIGARVLPIQVIVNNQSSSELRIVPEQTFLVQSDGTMWGVLSADMARDRIESRTTWGELGPRAGRGAVLGSLGGAIVGTAVGVVTDENIGSALGKGLVVGAAGGAVVGGADALTDEEVGRQVGRDLRDASLQNKAVGTGELGHGILFFPAEAEGGLRLRLRVLQVDSGQTHDLEFAL
ncbi:MAG: hypothetical protein R6X33_02680 [Candidatus Brocadiia bacterium]